MMAENRVTFTNDYNKRRKPSHGSGQLNYNNTENRNQARRDTTDTQKSAFEGATQFYPRNNWGNPARNNSFNSGRGQSIDGYQNQLANRNDYNYLRNDSSGTPTKGTWQSIAANSPCFWSETRPTAEPTVSALVV